MSRKAPHPKGISFAPHPALCSPAAYGNEDMECRSFQLFFSVSAIVIWGDSE